MASATRWTPAYVALGSNLDEPLERVREAQGALARLPGVRVERVSRPWRTPPVGLEAQPTFVNAAAALLTTLDPGALHAALVQLERALGKVPPPVRFGPRRIDLDLLVHGTATLADPLLELPHPRLHARAFVLYPLAEIAPDLWIPGRGRVRTLAARVDAAGLAPLTDDGHAVDEHTPATRASSTQP